MTEGIFNPFGEPKKKKQNFLASTAETPLDTEFVSPAPGDLRLDGGSYVIVLKNTPLDDMKIKLGALMADAQHKHPNEFLAHGIKILPLGNTYQADPEETLLKTPSGYLFVYIGELAEDKIEDEAFRRLGYLLHQINDRELLETHNIKIIPRR